MSIRTVKVLGGLLALACFAGRVSRAHAGATLKGGASVQLAEEIIAVKQSPPITRGDETFCELRWAEDRRSLLADSFRFRYEVDVVRSGWLQGECQPVADGSSERLVVLGKHSYRTLSDPWRETESPELYAAIRAYSRQPSESGRNKVIQTFPLLRTPDSPTLHDTPDSTTVWTPRFACKHIAFTYLFQSPKGTCDAKVKRTATIVETKSTLDYGTDSFAPPNDVSVNGLEKEYAQRAVRFEWLNPIGKLDHCSGFMLSPTFALTARHCVEDEQRPSQSCLQNSMYCQSYIADLDARAYRVGASLYVRSVIGQSPQSSGKPSDDAIVALSSSAAVRMAARRWPPLAPMSLESERFRRGSPLTLLSYPLGFSLQASRSCEVVYPTAANLSGTEDLFHTCYALHGSSGGALLAPWGRLLSPIALVTEAERPCDAPDASEWIDDRRKKVKAEPWFAAYKSYEARSCASHAVQVGQALCERCLKDPVPACEEILVEFRSSADDDAKPTTPLDICKGSFLK